MVTLLDVDYAIELKANCTALALASSVCALLRSTVSVAYRYDSAGSKVLTASPRTPWPFTRRLPAPCLPEGA